MQRVLAVFVCVTLGILASSARAEGLDPKVQSKVDEAVKQVQVWAKDAAIVEAVKAVNANAPADYKAMTQEKWAGLTVTDPFVRGFSKNPAAQFIKSKKSDAISEAFVSAADGTKVAFLSKTSGWSHAGKAKHDDPMKGKNWQGKVEVDESTGVRQVQVGVPVLDGDKAIGSIVVGINIAALE